MHLDPYIIFADSDNCNYFWVTGSYEIRSDIPMSEEDRKFEEAIKEFKEIEYDSEQCQSCGNELLTADGLLKSICENCDEDV